MLLYANPPAIGVTKASDIFGIYPVVPNSAGCGSIVKSCPDVMSFGSFDLAME